MRLRDTTHVIGSRGAVCGSDSDRRAQAWMTPTCAKCAERKAGVFRLYAAMARHLMAKHGRPVSAGEVAFHTVGHGRKAGEILLDVERALEEAGLRRASWMQGGRWHDVSTWKAA